MLASLFSLPPSLPHRTRETRRFEKFFFFQVWEGDMSICIYAQFDDGSIATALVDYYFTQS